MAIERREIIGDGQALGQGGNDDPEGRRIGQMGASSIFDVVTGILGYEIFSDRESLAAEGYVAFSEEASTFAEGTLVAFGETLPPEA